MKNNWLKSIEYKTVPLSGVDVNDRIVTGIAAVFGNVDEGGDITHPGAFKKTIAEQTGRVKHLWNHDFNQPPTAVVKDLREVGRDELPADVRTRYADAKGGLVVVREYLDTPRGNEILAGIKAGAITEMSYGYNVTQKDFTKGSDGRAIRNLRQVRLLDTSDVPWGMNPATVAAKSMTEQLAYLLDEAADLTNLMAVGQQLTPDDLAQIQQVIASLQAVLQAASAAEAPDAMDASMSSEEAPMEMMSAVPPAPDQSKAHTVNAAALLARLAIAEREYA